MMQPSELATARVDANERAGLWIPFNQDAGLVPKEQMRILEYKAPGPPVWEGESKGGSK